MEVRLPKYKIPLIATREKSSVQSNWLCVARQMSKSDLTVVGAYKTKCILYSGENLEQT